MKIDIALGIHYLVEERGLVLPHGLLPGSFVGGEDTFFDAESWAAYDWHLVGGKIPAIKARDPSASEKPEWSVILAAVEAGTLRDRKLYCRTEIENEEARRICGAYIGDVPVPQILQHEALYRVFAIEARLDLSAKHAERNRLHKVAEGLRARVDGASSVEAVESIDPADDALWAPPAS